jgi:hypothetical protein
MDSDEDESDKFRMLYIVLPYQDRRGVYFQAADTLGYLLAEHTYSFDKMEPEVLA